MMHLPLQASFKQNAQVQPSQDSNSEECFCRYYNLERLDTVDVNQVMKVPAFLVQPCIVK